jgi:hypothetical protein
MENRRSLIYIHDSKLYCGKVPEAGREIAPLRYENCSL